jgi:AcrR family transcriptional regulator
MTTEFRQPRSDAVANRERLLDAAARAFTTDGSAASLKDIAKEAGVGIGTLYRHFPTRESLIEATHENELAHLCASAGELLAAEPADVALRTWLLRWIDYLRAKDGLAKALRATAPAKTPGPVAASAEKSAPTSAPVGVAFPGARVLALAAVGELLDAGVAGGALRSDIHPLDVLVSGNGIALAALDDEQAERMLDYLMDALRSRS